VDQSRRERLKEVARFLSTVAQSVKEIRKQERDAYQGAKFACEQAQVHFALIVVESLLVSSESVLRAIAVAEVGGAEAKKQALAIFRPELEAVSREVKSLLGPEFHDANIRRFVGARLPNGESALLYILARAGKLGLDLNMPQARAIVSFMALYEAGQSDADQVRTEDDGIRAAAEAAAQAAAKAAAQMSFASTDDRVAAAEAILGKPNATDADVELALAILAGE
jgi:hypothetical protein